MSRSRITDAWPRVRLGYLVDEIGGSTPSKERPEFWDGDVPWVSPKDMKSSVLNDSIDHVSPIALSASRLRMVPIGSVLMVVRGMILAHSVPVALTTGPVTVNQDMKALVPRSRIGGRFLLYCLRAYRDQLLTLVEEAGHGTRCLRSELWRKFEVPVPPSRIQAAIADFLDRKTAAIDALIDKKQKLLDLLAEKRAALINHAVTKGLNPDAPMKDSGISWIGEIPAHWAIAPLNSRYSVQLGKMLDSSKVTGTRLAPYLRNADVQWDRINTTNLPQMDFSVSDRKKFELRAGDILMCEGGANKKVVGRSAIWSGSLAECYYQKALHRIRSTHSEAAEEQPRFLLFAIQAASDVGLFVADSNANIFHLPAEKLRILRFPFPPADEQKRIVREVDRALARCRAVEGTIGDQIERLHEYRQALITAAVTGQLDVTNEAAA